MPEDTATELTPVTRSSYLQISNTSAVTESGNIYSFTSQETFRLSNFSGDTADLWDYYGGSTAAGAYIGITGTFTGESVLATPPDTLSGGYHIIGSAVVAQDAALTVGDGADISLCRNGSGTSCYLYVRGTLTAENEVPAALFKSASCPYTYIMIQNGGSMDLRNANINLQDSTSWSRVYVENGTLNMEGGAINLGSNSNCRVFVRAEGVLNLTGVNVRNMVDVNGQATMRSCTLSNWVTVDRGGVLNMEDVTVYAPLKCEEEAQLTLKNSAVRSILGIYGDATLDNVVSGTLQVGDYTSISVGDGGYTIQAQEVVRFYSLNRDCAEFLRSFSWNATAEHTYVGVWHVVHGDVKMDSLEGLVTDGYHMVADTTLSEDSTLVMGEGVGIQLDGNRQFTVNGSFVADNESEADVLTGSGAGISTQIRIQNGGSMDLHNANINLNGVWGENHLYVENGSLNMEGGTLDLGTSQGSGVDVRSDGALNLSGVEVVNKLSVSGEAAISDCTLQGRPQWEAAACSEWRMSPSIPLSHAKRALRWNWRGARVSPPSPSTKIAPPPPCIIATSPAQRWI